MQINGMNDFLSRITAPREQVLKNINIANTVSSSVGKPQEDSVELSNLSKRLRFQPEEAVALDLKEKINGDKFLLLMDRSISKVEATLGEMRSLALAAADSSLSDVDRLQMQVRMEELSGKLGRDANEMSNRLASMSGYGGIKSLGVSSTSGDNNGLLERALDRAFNGEAWDVAEHYEEGETGFRATDGRWVVTDDEDIPTVSQILAESGTLVLMDESSALRSAERISGELKAVKGIRKEFEEFVEQLPTPPQGEKRSKTEAAVIAKILEEEQTRAEALRAMLNTNGEKENPRKEALKAQFDMRIENEGEEEKEKLKVYTELGIMEYNSEGNLRLTRPANPKGKMFAKVEKMFDEIVKNLSRGRIPEGIRADTPYSLLKNT